jgi:hypothetical protein
VPVAGDPAKNVRIRVTATNPRGSLSAFSRPVQTQALVPTSPDAPQPFTVPAGVTSLAVDVSGASGADSGPTTASAQGGAGGRVTANLAVNPADVLQVHVGRRGSIATSAGLQATPAWNGGGTTNALVCSGEMPGGGGGATDIRSGGGASLTGVAGTDPRLVVAGGGGGAGSGGAGGPGGLTTAQSAPTGAAAAGGPGTPSAGGAASGSGATAGTAGTGGDGISAPCGGGGGGAGWWGGGGGRAGAGGGGSSYASATLASSVQHWSGVSTGDGAVYLSYARGANVVSFTPAAADTSASSLTYTLLFDGTVTGLAATDFTVGGTATGWTVSAVSGSGAGPYTVTATRGAGATDGTLVISLRAASVTDGFGGTAPGAKSDASSVIVDTAGPSVASFTTATVSPSNAAGLTYTVTFNEPVTGLSGGDFTVGGTATGWSVTGVTAAGANAYTVTLNGTMGTDGTVMPRLAAGAVADAAGNTGPAAEASGTTTTIDRQAPQVTELSATTPTRSGSVAYTLTFDEAISGLAAGDFTIGGTSTGWTVTGVSASSGTTFTVQLARSGPSDGTLVLGLGAGTVSDRAGNAGPAASYTGTTVTIDRTAPTVSTFSATTPTRTSPIAYTLTFSEPVTGLGAGDFTVGGTSAGWTVASVSGSGASYTVSVSNDSPSTGTVVLTLSPGAVTDAAGNTAPGSASAAGAVTFDAVPPTATWTPPASPTNAAVPSFTLAFDKPVSGIASGDFSNQGTATGCVFTPSASSGTSITVSASGCSEGTVSARLAADAVTDAPGNMGPATDADSGAIPPRLRHRRHRAGNRRPHAHGYLFRVDGRLRHRFGRRSLHGHAHRGIAHQRHPGPRPGAGRGHRRGGQYRSFVGCQRHGHDHRGRHAARLALVHIRPDGRDHRHHRHVRVYRRGCG